EAHPRETRVALGLPLPRSLLCPHGCSLNHPRGAGLTAAPGSIIFTASSPTRRRRRRRTSLGWHGAASARVARPRHCAGDGGRPHRRGLRLDPIARGTPRLGPLSPAGAARRLASRAHSGVGRGRRRRALVGIFFLLALLQLLSLAAERDPQSSVVHGG